LQSGEPDAGFFFPLLRFGAVVARQFFFVCVGLAAVAVVGLVVDDDDVLLAFGRGFPD
jgi:hypothetical protein